MELAGMRNQGGRFLTIGAIFALSALISGAVVSMRSDSGHVSPQAVIAAGDDRLPSESAADWITYSDYVVIATATGETTSKPPAIDLERGEGVIERTVALQVDDVLWHRNDADAPKPTSFAWPAFGWVWHETPENRTELVDPDQARVEPGHSYLMAIQWVPQHCLPDGRMIPGAWRGLGAGSTIPFDKGVVGVGEFGGTQQSLEQAAERAQTKRSTSSVADALLGQDASAVATVLEDAKEYDKTEDYGTSIRACG